MNMTINESMDTLSITQMSQALDWEEDQIEERPSQTTNIPSCLAEQAMLPKEKWKSFTNL